MSKGTLIRIIEDQNSELAKEILLNESAIYEAEKEIQKLHIDLLVHPRISTRVQALKIAIERIVKENDLYKSVIFENEIKIKNLKKGQ
jgi:hypothetical protein